jgi:hypothetical protein
MAKKSLSMQGKVIAALQAGKTLTVAQIESFGLAKPYNAIAIARARGLNVLTQTKTVKNKTTTFYSLSTGFNHG